MSDNQSTFTEEDQRILGKTQLIRERIIDQLSKPNQPLPSDENEQRLLIQVLDSADKQVLMKSKIKSDDNQSKTQQQIAQITADILLATRKGILNAPVDTSAKLLNESIQPDKLVDGQLSMGHQEILAEDILTQP